MKEINCALVDITEFQSKILDYIASDELDKMINNTIFADDTHARLAVSHGMAIAAMLTSQCDLVYATKIIEEK